MIFLFIYSKIYNKILEPAAQRLTLTAYHHIAAYAVQFILGIIFGIEKFIKEINSEGKWKINISKLLILGIPSLFFSAIISIYILPISFIIEFITAKGVMQFFRMFLGYICITSLYKQKNAY
jgi:TM2 domain-containing membrane protein YozV